MPGSIHSVTPAKAGVHFHRRIVNMDPGFRRDDNKG